MGGFWEHLTHLTPHLGVFSEALRSYLKRLRRRVFELIFMIYLKLFSICTPDILWWTQAEMPLGALHFPQALQYVILCNVRGAQNTIYSFDTRNRSFRDYITLFHI